MKETATVLNFPKEHTLLHVRNIKHGIRSTANKWIIKDQRQNKYATKMYGLCSCMHRNTCNVATVV